MSWLSHLAVLGLPLIAPEGLFYQLPPDGSWVRFHVVYTVTAGGQMQRGEQVLTMASVGEVVEEGEPCRWIEFKIEANENGTDRLWIRKLLIPVRFLRRGENPTLHVVRGWTQQEGTEIEPAVAVHGRWPAFLTGRLNDEKALPPAPVTGKLGTLQAEGVTGWIEFAEGPQYTKVRYESRLHPTAPFGVLTTHMVFEVIAPGSAYTIDSGATLVDSGVGAVTALPSHK